jgi:hypothetical protein
MVRRIDIDIASLAVTECCAYDPGTISEFQNPGVYSDPSTLSEDNVVLDRCPIAQ